MGYSIVKKGDAAFVVFDGLRDVPHAFSTRLGGVSTGHCASLNFTVSTGDTRDNLLKNYEVVADFIGKPVSSFCISRQVHETNIYRVDSSNAGNGLFQPQAFESCDGMVTDDPGVTLVTFYADCIPVMIYDPVHNAVGAAHCGWRGTAAGMAAKLAGKMTEEFGSRPEELRASVGPGIGKCCFETHGEVPEAILGLLGPAYGEFIEDIGGGKYKVNLAGVNKKVLTESGLSADNIDTCDLCTCCRGDLFHSHRRTGLLRGSMAAFIAPGTRQYLQ